MEMLNFDPADLDTARMPATSHNLAREDDETIKLDAHRGMKAQQATEIRRLVADVEANEKELRKRQDELEIQLVAAPAKSW